MNSDFLCSCEQRMVGDLLAFMANLDAGLLLCGISGKF
jgi:hypothetical protein